MISCKLEMQTRNEVMVMPTDPGGNNADEDYECICGCLSALVTDSQAIVVIFSPVTSISAFSQIDMILF
jgi:hypothetical protein